MTVRQNKAITVCLDMYYMGLLKRTLVLTHFKFDGLRFRYLLKRTYAKGAIRISSSLSTITQHMIEKEKAQAMNNHTGNIHGASKNAKIKCRADIHRGTRMTAICFVHRVGTTFRQPDR